MQSFRLKLIGVLGLVILLTTAAFGQTLNRTASGQPEIYFVPDVINQFNQLALRPDALAFGRDGQPDADLSKHFQGIVRKHGPGTPYLFLSLNGNDSDCVFCNDEEGHLLIIKMESRDINGERMRSNRLVKGWQIAQVLPGNVINTWPTPPDPRDKTVFRIDFDGQNGWPNYGHPGAMQLVGDVLVVPLSHPYTEGDLENRILFINVANPEAPALTSQFDPLSVSPADEDFGAGIVAVTPVLNPNGPGVRYIMLIAGKSDQDLRLYRSLPTREDGSTDLKSTNLKWEYIRNWSGSQLDDGDEDTWPGDASKSHQMINFVRQQSLNGPLYLIGARNPAPAIQPGSGDDYFHLYRIHVDQYGNPEEDLLTQIERKNVGTTTIGGGGDASHFAGSTGVYVSPTGELIMYASQHDEAGPPSLKPDGSAGEKTVRFGEYRHREMVRPDSPTKQPSVQTFGTLEVDEGSTLTLNAQGKAPITKAWLQLFEDDGMGLTLSEGVFDTNRWLAIDQEDWAKDDYDNFPKLLWFMNDNAGSWRWFAPAGCSLEVNQHSFDDGDFPGRRKTLVGTGDVVGAPDLNAVKDDADEGDMDDMISSMRFACDAYYSATIGVAWDFDRNGTFEKQGNNQTFDAKELDGRPSVYAVPVRAQHPTDTTPLGTSAPATVDITIRNVAPSVSDLELVDPLGFKVGVDVPFAVANLQYTAQASFTDPGRPDHQTAELNFGDGTVVENGSMDVFSDAFGGATGQVKHGHRFTASGTHTIVLKVKDDDNDAGTVNKSITVVTPAQVIQSVIDDIDQRLATATNQRVIRALRDARDNLAGQNNGAANNGALDALELDDFVAAIGKIGAAIEALQRAETAGAGDLSNLKYLLGLAAESIAQGTYQDAVELVGTPSSGQAMQLETIRQLITSGHTMLAAKQYVGAIELFKDAAGRALALP